MQYIYWYLKSSDFRKFLLYKINISSTSTYLHEIYVCIILQNSIRTKIEVRAQW